MLAIVGSAAVLATVRKGELRRHTDVDEAFAEKRPVKRCGLKQKCGFPKV